MSLIFGWLCVLSQEDKHVNLVWIQQGPRWGCNVSGSAENTLRRGAGGTYTQVFSGHSCQQREVLCVARPPCQRVIFPSDRLLLCVNCLLCSSALLYGGLRRGDLALASFKFFGSPFSSGLKPKCCQICELAFFFLTKSSMSVLKRCMHIQILPPSPQFRMHFPFKIKVRGCRNNCSMIDIVKNIAYDGKYRDIR